MKITTNTDPSKKPTLQIEPENYGEELVVDRIADDLEMADIKVHKFEDVDNPQKWGITVWLDEKGE